MHRQIDDIVETLKTAKQRGVSTVLLTGAGCSVSAGIPTAAGFVDLIRERYPRSYDRAEPKQYPHCMAQLSVSERRDLIIRYIEQAKVNWAHVGIAQLMLHGFIDRVLTTNFDPLVMRACALVDVFPAIYDFAASQYYKPADIPGNALFHLHGQHTGFVLLNTKEECDRHARHLAPVFEDAGRRRVWLVVGYSGENDPVFEHLAKVDQFDNKLYWIGYKESEPQQHVREKLLSGSKDAYYVKGFDADEFFVTLAQRLDCFPPDYVARPFSHLDNRFEKLAPFRMPGQPDQTRGTNVVTVTRQLIQHAKHIFEERTGIRVAAPRNVIPAEDAPLVLKAVGHLIAGQYDQILEMRPRKGQPFPEGLREPISLSYCAKGDALIATAARQHGSAFERNISEAIEQYRRALEVHDQCWQAYQGWGRALTSRSLSFLDSRTSADLDKAIEKFEEAIKQKGDKRILLIYIINALQSHVSLGGINVDKLLDRIEIYLDRALQIVPVFPQLRALQANLWMERGNRRTDAEGNALLHRAHDEYLAIANSEPAMGAIWHNAGNAIAMLAQRSSNEESAVLFQRALEYYHQMPVSPDQSPITCNAIGWLYSAWGEKSAGELREQRLTKAVDYLSQALEGQPDFVMALGNLFAVQRLRAAALPPEQAAELLYQVVNRIDAAESASAPNAFYDQLRAGVLVELARWVSAPEADLLRKQAIELYRSIAKSHRERPGIADALAGLLLFRSNNVGALDRGAALREACGWYLREHKLRPHDVQVAYAYGQALHQLSHLSEGKDKERLVGQAVEVLRPFGVPESPAVLHVMLASLLEEQARLRSTKHALGLLKEAEQLIKAAYGRHPEPAKVLIRWAMLLVGQKEYSVSEKAPMLLDQSASKLREALGHSPDDPWCHAVLGSVLVWRERALGDQDSEQRLRDAICHLEQGPTDMAFVQAGLADAYRLLAEISQGPEAQSQLERAANHAACAAKMEPANAGYAANLGYLYHERATDAPESIREALLVEADRQYARAYELDSTKIAVVVGRGRVLAQLAVLHEGDEADRRWREVDELFVSTTKSHPKNREILADWGSALIARAEGMQTPHAWEKAEQVFRRALDIEATAGSRAAWPHVGAAIALHGRAALAKTSTESVELATQAQAELRFALEVEPANPDALGLLAAVTIMLTKSAVPSMKAILLTGCHASLAAAILSPPLPSRFLNQWGHLLIELAGVSSEAQRDDLFRQAVEKFEQAANRGYTYHYDLFNQAVAWLIWAEQSNSEGASTRLDRAEYLLNQSLKIQPTPAVQAAMIELHALRAFIGPAGVDAERLQNAYSELDALIITEPNNALVHVGAARLYLLCAERGAEQQAQQLREAAAEHIAAAEQLAPGCTAGGWSIRRLEERQLVRVRSRNQPVDELPNAIFSSLSEAEISQRKNIVTDK